VTASRTSRIIAGANRLSALLADGKPHGNAEIKNKCGLPWDSPITAEVRRYLREHGVFITPHVLDGYWVMTDEAVDIRKHAIRRGKNHYAEAVRIAQSAAGALVRNPTDVALNYELRERQMTVYAIGNALGKTPTEMAKDMQPSTPPPSVSTLP
jgi:hypothetical protein